MRGVEGIPPTHLHPPGVVIKLTTAGCQCVGGVCLLPFGPRSARGALLSSPLLPRPVPWRTQGQWRGGTDPPPGVHAPPSRPRPRPLLSSLLSSLLSLSLPPSFLFPSSPPMAPIPPHPLSHTPFSPLLPPPLPRLPPSGGLPPRRPPSLYYYTYYSRGVVRVLRVRCGGEG